MYHESLSHERNSFVTLTYEDAPPKLNAKHLQLFIKTLRRHSAIPIRYFAVGEYGEKTHRAHYHAILFGEDFLGGAFTINDELYGNHILDRLWKRGNTAIAPFNMATACYVAGYVNKKLGDNETFNLMSRFPPIGYDYVARWQDQLARTEKIIIEGQEYPIPKKYLEWQEPSKTRPIPVHLDTVRGNRRKYLQAKEPEAIRNQEKNLRSKLNLKDHKL